MKVVLSEKQIQKRVKELGEQITQAYEKHAETLYVVGILRGGFVFMADLVRAIELPLEIDFVWASSYGAAMKSSGHVSLVRDLEIPIEDRHVLIVEDIVDTGHTMDFMLRHLEKRKPKSLKVCALLHKPAREIKKVPIEYLGFTIEDHFVVGYGLDFNNRHREYRDIVILPPEGRN